ncbi:uncharacterized protein B0H64DRAFT_374518 [Chaetomium fimeti]|uniref:Uncharacterized protein n=1 Tax=Chaetomium fimeti TaxID=1854472 RepID=A0AAE0LT02_9PEZI|nr:hypothetical protein B0H64DRAFT_374518 [Chaetomium fimeti]
MAGALAKNDRVGEFDLVIRADIHGIILIKNANPRLGREMTVYKQDLGKNPATGDEWYTVDWGETAKQAEASGVPRAKRKIKDFISKFYGADDTEAKAAREHYQVIKSYKRVADTSVKCRAR